MTRPTAVISGAGVAGPALAYFLVRGGYDVTVVERAPTVRAGGYPVDFRGDALDVLREIGILDELRGHATGMRGTAVVDDAGAPIGQLPAEAFGGDLEVPKPDLTRVLHRVTAGDVEYVFGDTITALTPHEHGVRTAFAHGATRDFTLVFGADGVHSAVRRLAFGAAEDPVRHLGMSGVGFTVPNYLGLDRTGLLQPGRGTAVYLFGTGRQEPLTVSLSFATATPDLDHRSRAEQEQAVRRAFAGRGWEVPHLLEAMSAAEDYYFASTVQVHLDRWHRDRVALLGDAGYCAAPTSGMGTSQALIGARALARCLTVGGRDHRAAFTAYEQELRPYVTANQALGLRTTGDLLTPAESPR